MGNERNFWVGKPIGARQPRSFVPRVKRNRQRRGLDGWQSSAAVVWLVLAVGFGAAYWLAGGDESGGWSSAPIEWNAVQAVPRAALDADDAAWIRRGQEPAIDGAAASVGAARSVARAQASFGLCHSGGGTNCVVDGDTLWIGGQNVRLADIDAPETHAPRCAGEQALGDRATRRLHALVNSGAVTLHGIDRDHDRYGRKLRIVAVRGTSVGDTLVGEGLARWYGNGRRSWCG